MQRQYVRPTAACVWPAKLLLLLLLLGIAQSAQCFTQHLPDRAHPEGAAANVAARLLRVLDADTHADVVRAVATEHGRAVGPRPRRLPPRPLFLALCAKAAAAATNAGMRSPAAGLLHDAAAADADSLVRVVELMAKPATQRSTWVLTYGTKPWLQA
eukprot:363740-Chlamydomonas_euryale.AAC.9